MSCTPWSPASIAFWSCITAASSPRAIRLWCCAVRRSRKSIWGSRPMPDAVPGTPLLAVHALDAFYGDIQALFGVSMEIGRGEAVAVIGANGAGKSALLRTIAGLLRARAEAIVFEGGL